MASSSPPPNENSQEFHIAQFPAIRPLGDLSQFAKPFKMATFQPREVGMFTLVRPDKSRLERDYYDDNRGLRPVFRCGKTAVVRRLSLNLTRGMNHPSYIERANNAHPTHDEHLEHILRWIKHHQETFMKLKPQVDIVCWRGKLHGLMITPYDFTYGGWILGACLINGVIYLTSYETQKENERNTSLTPAERIFMYWGYKFEQFMTNDRSNDAIFSEPIIMNEGCHAMLFSKLGKIGILYGAEVDCYDPQLPETVKGPKRYIELKTNAIIKNHSDSLKFGRRKAMKWWAQSFVAGIPKIIVGFRNDGGIVLKTEEIGTQQLAADYGHEWDPSVCMNFLNEFVAFIREVVIEEHDKAIYKFEWDPKWTRQHVAVTRLPPTLANTFIPNWYLEQLPK